MDIPVQSAVTVNTEPHIESLMSPDDATAYICKVRGKTLFVSVGQRAPIKDDPGRVFSIIGNVKVSRKDALQFLDSAYSETLAKRGAMVAIREYGSCVFIGDSA